MEFSRLDQFQAVLVGVAVADAAAHGQIVPSNARVSPQSWPAPHWPAPHWPETSWCQALRHVAHQVALPDHGGNAANAWAANVWVEGFPAVEGAIIQIPILLRYLDTPDIQPLWIAQRLGLPVSEDALTVQLYAILQTLLCNPNHSLSMRLKALQAQLDRFAQHPGSQHPEIVLLAQSIQSTLHAAGDFRLAIANRLLTTRLLTTHLPTAISPLQPVLIGLLCTALRGLKTVPISWRQTLRLSQPSPWYLSRWGVADERGLREIAIDLWRAWSGL